MCIESEGRKESIRRKIRKTRVIITPLMSVLRVLSVPCTVRLIHQGLGLFLAPAKLRSQKQGERVWGERPRPHFIWQGHLMGRTAPGRCCFWGASKWTCQMPQTGNRKLLLNDVKYKGLFQVRQKLRYFVFPCMLTW